MDEQIHLPAIENSDIALFLHKNDYDLEKAKVSIDDYLTIRALLPEFFKSRDAVKSQELKNIFDVV